MQARKWSIQAVMEALSVTISNWKPTPEASEPIQKPLELEKMESGLVLLRA